jgi:hypothetical protein
VPICHFRQEKDLFLRLGNENWFAHRTVLILSLTRRNCRVPQSNIASLVKIRLREGECVLD